MGGPNKNAARMRKQRLEETQSKMNERLKQNNIRNKKQRFSDATEKRKNRISKIKNFVKQKLDRENSDEKQRRLSLIRNRLANETAEQREHRFTLINKRLSQQTEEERSQRLIYARERAAHVTERETTEERQIRLQNLRRSARERKPVFDMDGFKAAINVFSDIPCAVCYKLLYPQQRRILRTATSSGLLLPNELKSGDIITCSRCFANLNKQKVPGQAYWNKMANVPIPNEIDVLTEVEKRLLCRVVPFLKIVKVQNRFSQHWCKGQVVLFAKDVVELAEQLPLHLNQAGLIIVTENLENVQRSRDFQVNISNLQRALQWLLSNNALYRDVRICFSNIIEISNITQIVHESLSNNRQQIVTAAVGGADAYVNLNDGASILHGSFHQGNERFSVESRGKQCTAIAAVACTAFLLIDPFTWSKSEIDYILILGDRYYRECMVARSNPDLQEINTEYLAVTELLPVLVYNNCKVNINVDFDHAINGHIDNDQSSDGFPNLKNALIMFFRQYSVGILTACSTSVALHIHRRCEPEDMTYWLFNSHAQGPRGCRAPLRGCACCMRFTDLDKLHYILRRNLFHKEAHGGNNNLLNVYSLTPITFTPENVIAQPLQDMPEAPEVQPLNKQTEVEHPRSGNRHIQLFEEMPPALELEQPHQDPDFEQSRSGNTETRFIYTTSMLHTIDEGVPELQSVVSVDNLDNEERMVKIRRKTTLPLNIEREQRMEELAWYFLFPDGRNGFGEKREVPITALDYFQSRVMSKEGRFQRNDYMFFALSVVEYFRAKASVSVSCRMRQGDHTPQDLVDNMHITMRNIRGSASYWRQCCSELIAMVRSLGPPTWFLTFSCNDLNWPDMQKALRIADGQNPDEFNLSFCDRLELVQKYPIVVARQFTLRLNALIRFIKSNDNCLGGAVADLWYRIEFQNRGSPHLHMLVWCENIPDFATSEGISVIQRVVSCSLIPESTTLRHLVESVQVHKHTSTCYKDRNNTACRFGFPRPVSENTICLEPDQILANNGRFCVLQRTNEETMINNYNPVLLSLWEGNIDVQPCGNVTAVAYYVAKYASKCEPNETGDVIREAVVNSKRRGGSVWNQLFSVSMAILSQRLISASECAYRLCHLPLRMSSRKAVFVNSCKPDQRFRMLRFEGEETSVYNNIFDRYILRPDNLENLSLAEFAVRYETVSSTTWNEDDGDVELRETDNEPAKFIRLRDNTRMRIRNKSAVLRTRYYTINTDREGYFYNLIVCHIPFRDEKQLVENNESTEECFIRRQHELRPLLNNVTTEQFAHAEQIIQQALAQAAVLNAVHGSVATQNPPVLCADEEILHDQDDYFEDIQERELMPDDVIVNHIQRLNVQQKRLFQQITKAIQNDIANKEDQLLLFITGGAGSGKSFVLKLLVEHIKRCYAPTVDALLKPTFVEVSSLTGVAARQIMGKTLHSLFSLPIEKAITMNYKRMSGQRLEQERRRWRYTRWLIIDEVSMVSYENLRIIHLRIQEFKNTINKLFGSVNVLLFGDIMQLPPVKGHWCFQQPASYAAEVNLWHQFSFCELTINMRQQHDVEFVDLLNNLRFGELTNEQLQILYERRHIPLEGEFVDGGAIRIYPTIKQVEEYNTKMTDIYSKSHRVYIIHSIDESREAATYGKKPPDNVIPKDVNNCGGLLHFIALAENSRIMLRRNISVTQGLVNGAMGLVKKFKWPALRRDQLEEGELPEAVLIKFDDESIGINMKDVDGYVEIAPVITTFQATRGYGDVERRMLPLILSWAVTVHKLQGTTLNTAVIDLGKKVFAKGQAYVALSRVKTLDGIALSDLDSRKVLSKPHDEKAMAEMRRLRDLP